MNDPEQPHAASRDSGATRTLSDLPLLPPGDGSPREKPVGLALAIRGEHFHIDVCRQDGSAILTLGAFPEDEVIATWRSLSLASGLPLLLRDADGSLRQPYPQLGPVQLGRRSDRRRLALLSGRRPRFLAKRKGSRMPRRPLVHREPEIVAGRTT